MGVIGLELDHNITVKFYFSLASTNPLYILISLNRKIMVMIRSNNITLLLLVLLFGFTSCDNSIDNPIQDPAGEITGSAIDFQKAVINYGLSTFQKVISEGNENVLISPLSLETALYMAMNGANDKTLEEFRVALKLEQFYPQGMNPHYKALIDKLEPKNESTRLGIANTVFYDEKMVTFHEKFKETVADVFDGDFNQANFGDEGSVDRINDWIEDKTEGRIEKILEEINDDEALFLISALFYKSDWEKGFLPTLTFQKPFTNEDNEEILVEQMYSDDYRRYYTGLDFSAVDLKFTDDEYSMTFILPGYGISTKDFVLGYNETEFYDFYIDLYTNKLQEGRIVTKLPKFKIRAHKNMKEILIDMGMKEAFEFADFSNMGTFMGSPYLSRVLHDTFLKIDEKGAEGGAVTAVGVAAESAPPTIEFNRPFVFIIRHVETNTPVFIGKLGNPE